MFLKKIISNNTQMSKKKFELKYWWNETDDVNLPVFSKFTELEMYFLEFS